MLIIFGLINKENQPLRWAILGLWWLLFILAIVIICVPKSESRTWAWVCIWISTVLDGISLLAFAIKVKNNSSVQTELINQANQNEIVQWDVEVTNTTDSTTQSVSPDAQQPTSSQQSTDEAQSWAVQQQVVNQSAINSESAPVAQPISEIQPDVSSPETSTAEVTPNTQPTE